VNGFAGLVIAIPNRPGRESFVLYDDLVPRRLPVAFTSARALVRTRSRPAPGANRRRPNGRFRTDEESLAVEYGRS